jgi:hypothetical protein
MLKRTVARDFWLFFFMDLLYVKAKILRLKQFRILCCVRKLLQIVGYFPALDYCEVFKEMWEFQKIML